MWRLHRWWCHTLSTCKEPPIHLKAKFSAWTSKILDCAPQWLVLKEECFCFLWTPPSIAFRLILLSLILVIDFYYVAFRYVFKLWQSPTGNKAPLDIEIVVAGFVSTVQNLIDLAGSESSKTETTGLRRKEGSYINKSLLTLGTVRPTLCSFGLQIISWNVSVTG